MNANVSQGVWVHYSTAPAHRKSCDYHVTVSSFSLTMQVISKSSEVLGDASTEEKYLIATSEQPLCALHRLGGGGFAACPVVPLQ